MVPGVGDVDDVGVRDLRGRARLAPQPLDEIGRLAVGGVKDLQRHALADVDVLGLVDAPHAALAAQLANVVAAADDGAEHGGRLVAVLGVGQRRFRLAVRLARSAEAEARLAHGGLAVAPLVVVRRIAGRGRLLDAPVRRRRCRRRRLRRRQRRRQAGGLVSDGAFPGSGGLRHRRPDLRLRGGHRRRRLLRRVPLPRLDDQRLALRGLLGDVLGVEVVEEGRQPRRIGRGRRLRQERRQILAQLFAAGVAILEIGRQRLERDAIQLGRHARRALRRRHDLRVAHAAQDLFRRVAVLGRARRLARRKQLPPGEQLPQDDPRRVEVGAAVELLAARLLGRHVADLAVDDAGRGLLQLQRRRRQPEVGQPHLAAVRQQHVGRRDVAVDELDVAEAVRVVETARELLDDVGGDVDGERDPFLRAAVPGRAQVLALDEVHRQVDLAGDLTRIEHRNEISVRQAHDDLGLVAEALQVLLVGQVREHRLDDAELRAVLRTGEREIERPHAAPRERLEQHVRSETAGKIVHVSLPLRCQAIGCRARTERGPKGVILRGPYHCRQKPQEVPNPRITSGRTGKRSLAKRLSGTMGRTSCRGGTYS